MPARVPFRDDEIGPDAGGLTEDGFVGREVPFGRDADGCNAFPESARHDLEPFEAITAGAALHVREALPEEGDIGVQAHGGGNRVE